MKKLPSEKELSRLEKMAHDRLIFLFKKKKLQGMERHLHIGLERIAEKGAFARTFARHLRDRGLNTVKQFADKVYIGSDHLEALQWLRFPVAFDVGKRKFGRHDDYLLGLSDLYWCPKEKHYIPAKNTRLI